MDYYAFRAQAAASLHSTAHDLATFVIANLQTTPVLNDDLKQLMHTGVKELGDAQIGLGFFIRPQAGIIGHGGANQGWRADIMFHQELKSGLVVLSNSDNAGFFIQQVRCEWEQTFASGAFQESCQARMEQHNSQQSMISLMMWGLIVASLALLVFRATTVRLDKVAVGLPTSKIRWALIVLFVLILCAAIVLLNTPFGVSIVYGFTTTLSAIDRFGEGMPKVLFAMYGLFVCFILFNFARKLPMSNSN